MPRYDFKCRNCYFHFHAWKSYGARRAGCPLCGASSPRSGAEAPLNNGSWGCEDKPVVPLCPQLGRWDSRGLD